jgi:hypothetical protein
MSDEFTRLGVNLATSSLGFTVQIVPPGRVVYRDASGEFVISTELFVKPLRLMLYRPKKEPERFDAVIPSVLRAIEFLGNRAEVWDYNDQSPRDTWRDAK